MLYNSEDVIRKSSIGLILHNLHAIIKDQMRKYVLG